MGKLDNAVIDTFRRAWMASGNGIRDTEAAVLIVRKADGRYYAELIGCTNQFRKISFKWNGSIRAVAHTHPAATGPEPSAKDIEVADQHRVPVLTLTSCGMYAYDPVSKKTLKLMNGTSWLNSVKWRFITGNW